MTSSSKRPRPFLKWAGGKTRVISQLAEFFPKEFSLYYEPFLGAGSVYFAISPREGRLNDLNKSLISVYKVVRDRPSILIHELSAIQGEYYALANIDDKRTYYMDRRQEFNSITKNNTRRAALFIFLNKTGFNGMYRENRAGEYNIPFGRQDRPMICDADNIRLVSRDLQRIELTSTSYKDALADASKGDFVYLDPPYYPISETSRFTEYQAGGFSTEDQVELRDLFRELDLRGCYVMMSNSVCKEIEELYEGYLMQKIQVGRAINSKKGKRGRIDEYVIMNYRSEDLHTHEGSNDIAAWK